MNAKEKDIAAMTVTKAREILEDHRENPYCTFVDKFFTAKGYLEGYAAGRSEALEGEEVQELIEAFDRLVVPPVEHRCEHGILWNLVWLTGAQDALSKFKEAIKEKGSFRGEK